MTAPMPPPLSPWRRFVRFVTGWMEPGHSEGDAVAALAIALIAVLCVAIVIGELL